jgi:hypothetical protein
MATGVIDTREKFTAGDNASSGQSFLKFTSMAVTPEPNVPHLSMTPAAICRPLKFAACVIEDSAVNIDTNISL